MESAMNTETSEIGRKCGSDEEDYESFFLQPASCPYDIKEKVCEANRLLQMEISERKNDFRVQFRENLNDFEPDLTDDDVQSIESYTEEVINEELRYVIDDNQLCDIIEEDIIEESIIESIIELHHKKIQEEEEEEENAIEESMAMPPHHFEYVQITQEQRVDEEINEVIISKNDDDDVEEIIEELNIFEEVELPQPPEHVPVIDESSQILSPIDINKQTASKVKYGRGAKSKSSKCSKPRQINCRQHCIEALESRLEICIGKLHLNEKPPLCPTLKLHRQRCCSGGCKNEQKLPLYTGLHSEYGLSSGQMERLAKRKEIVRVKEEREREVAEAYRRRKIAQNEIIFRQWLKDIAMRKAIAREREKDIISGRTNGAVNGANCISIRRAQEKRVEKPRPKTANCITSIQLNLEEGRKRPHTTSARIFIEVPSSLLVDGLRVGDLLVRQVGRKNAKRGSELSFVS